MYVNWAWFEEKLETLQECGGTETIIKLARESRAGDYTALVTEKPRGMLPLSALAGE